MPTGAQANYLPPASCRQVLGGVLQLLKSERTIILPYLTGAKHICKLPGLQIYFESSLQLDTDGSKYSALDKTGQTGTSLQDQGHPVDSDRIPYFVLPKTFASAHHIRLGDIAAVTHNGRLVFAMLADHGPSWKIGEGSIALHRLLGYERIQQGRLHDLGISGEVLTLVFPRSGNHTPQTPDRIQFKGSALFNNLAHTQARLGAGPAVI